MAYYSLNHSAVAKTTIYSRQRIEQVIYSIYKKTNLNPDKFYDLIKLLKKSKFMMKMNNIIEVVYLTKAELIQYRSICAEIEEINVILKDNTVCGTVRGSDSEFPYVQHSINVGGVTSTKDNIQLLTKLKKLETQKERIENFIDSIDDSLTRRIFKYRYLFGDKIMSWQRIAFKIGEHDEQYPRKIHNKFLKKCKLDEKDEF